MAPAIGLEPMSVLAAATSRPALTPGHAVLLLTCCRGGALVTPGLSSLLPDESGLCCRCGVRRGWLGADRAEQQVINDLALPQQVDLP